MFGKTATANKKKNNGSKGDNRANKTRNLSRLVPANFQYKNTRAIVKGEVSRKGRVK